MISDDQLKELRALCEKATPDLTLNGRSEGIFVREGDRDKHVALFSGTNLVNDSAFYEVARTAVPALLDGYSQLITQLEELKATLAERLDEVERLRVENAYSLSAYEAFKDVLQAENSRLQEKVAAFIEAGCGISPDLFSDVCNERDDLFEENRRLKNSKKEET